LRDGFADSVISATTAEIPAQTVANVLWGRMWVAIEKCFTRHNKPRGTEAALGSVIVHKGLLQGMQLPALH
jgi:uncharacterized membrane protein